MKLVIVSGRSGSGKSVVLKALEDAGYYCIDNLPLGLTLNVINDHILKNELIAISVDARNPSDLEQFSGEMEKIKAAAPHARILFIDADENILLKRFSETRRRHPLTKQGYSLRDAIHEENKFYQSDTLSNASYRFYDWKVYIERGDSTSNKIQFY